MQYHRIDQANQLLEQGRKSLIFRSHQLGSTLFVKIVLIIDIFFSVEICPAEEYLSSKRKSSSVERSSKRFVFCFSSSSSSIEHRI